MGFMDELKKLTQPYDDDNDFYEDANEDFLPKKENVSQAAASDEQQFEESFSAEQQAAENSKRPRQSKTSGAGGSIFGNLGDKRQTQAREEAPRQASRTQKKRPAAASGQQVVLFNPKNFDEAGELVTYVSQGRSLVMALEGLQTDTARRLLDFISGICFAMNAKITPVSAKTYFITPENVDLLDAQAIQSSAASDQEDF